MNYEHELESILGDASEISAGTRNLTWGTHRQRQTAIVAAVDGRLQKMESENEALRHMMRQPKERERVLGEMLAEETKRRALGAGVLRYQVERKLSGLSQRHRDFVHRRMHDTSLNFPNALDRLGPAEMLMLAMYRETRRTAVETASPKALLTILRTGVERQDASGMVDVELVEQRADRGGLATTDGDLHDANALNDLLAAMREMRMPRELMTVDVEQIVERAQRAISLAATMRIEPVNPDMNHDAQEAYAAEKTALDEAVNQ